MIPVTVSGLLFAGAAHAAVLEAGPGKHFARPSLAIAKAKDGDTVRVTAGLYSDCAIIRQKGLTIEGVGDEVTLAGPVCDNKGILVIKGADVTVRNLTLTTARSTYGNGAGIRAEGARLLVDHTKFINNENGILAANDLTVSLKVMDSIFSGNGQCRPDCAHGIYMGHGASLRVEHSKFFRQNEGHHIKSRALVTEIVENVISDGPFGTASVLIDIPNGGTVLIEKNDMVKGPKASNQSNTIMIAEEGEGNAGGPIDIRGNHFVNTQTRGTNFVNNFGTRPARLVDNILGGEVNPLRGLGSIE